MPRPVPRENKHCCAGPLCLDDRIAGPAKRRLEILVSRPLFAAQRLSNPGAADQADAEISHKHARVRAERKNQKGTIAGWHRFAASVFLCGPATRFAWAFGGRT